jgi:hypothetical protein
MCRHVWQWRAGRHGRRTSAMPAHTAMAGRSKHETNSNDRNINNQNGKRYHQTAFVLNFEHLNFDIVSACPGATCLDDSAAYVTQVWARDFGFRYSDFHNRYCVSSTC